MSAFGTKLRKADELYMHWCPGCKEVHAINVGSDIGPNWTFNDCPEFPTFSPSVKISSSRWDEAKATMVEFTQCHYFITNGEIQFCGDCAHDLNGQTVELPNFKRS
jgi:hypothetical protein